jgi:hypothetical protein
MFIYQKVQGEYAVIALDYARGSEEQRISGPVLLDGRKYYEIVYIKKFLGLASNEITGRIIIDEQDRVISDKNMLKKIVEVFYYFSLFFGSQSNDLKRALKSEAALKKDKSDYADSCVLLQYFSSQDVAGATRVKNILEKYPGMKEESNKVLKMIVDKAEEYKNSETLTEEMLQEILKMYEKMHLLNFEEVKLVNTASEYYDEMKKQIRTHRRKIKSRLDKKLQLSLTKLESIMTFYINILKYYTTVINYSSERYKKYLSERDNKCIGNNYSLLRS